ncbi:two-component system OmpR family sensor kinase [Catenulispora sp. GAS73]|uniref:sensor histidine kinase n=1 Tax=Catenulispora sp. GAS73 TaxID=3156269 RepID=UPI0035129672
MFRRSAPPAPERRILSRAAAALACRIAVGFLLALALLGFCAYRVVLGEQRTQARHMMSTALEVGSPDAVTPCLWLFEIDGATVRHPAQIPAGFPLGSAVAAAQPGAPPAQTQVTAGPTVYDVLTVRHGGVTRQAVLDTWYQQADLDHLVRALLLVGLLGVVLATVVGVVLGRRSIAPLGDALDRQRRFVADASHELRTPLTRLHTRAQMLLRSQGGEPLSERLTGELTAIVQSAGELNDVVEDLLMSAGMRTDPTRCEEFDLATLAAEVIEAECLRLGSREMVLNTVGEELTIKGARSPIRRMISTLIDNAVSHTEADGRIEVAVRQAGRGIVELEVTDDGTGFDPADRERIFERFAQSGSPGPHHFGLGLALAREIAADHGGTIRAVGRVGAGATFTVRLPGAG